VPTYNGGRYIEAALASVAAQDYPNVEVVVVDDASSDDTLEKVRDWEGGRARVFVHRRNRGHVTTWNETIARSDGSLVKFLHQDDELRADCVTRMVEAIQSAPTAGLVFSRRRILFEDLAEEMQRAWLASAGQLDRPFGELAPINDGRELLRQWVDAGLYGNWIGEPSAVLIRREAVARVGGFARHVIQATDMELWARIMARFDVCFIREELATFRVGTSSLSFKNRATRSYWLDRLWALEILTRDDELVRALPQLLPLLRAERHQAFRSTLRLGRIRDGSRVPPAAYLHYARFRAISALRPGHVPFPRL